MTNTKKKAAPDTAKPPKKQKVRVYSAGPWRSAPHDILTEQRIFADSDVVAAEVHQNSDRKWMWFARPTPRGAGRDGSSETREMAMGAADAMLWLLGVKHDDVRPTGTAMRPIPTLSGWTDAEGGTAMQRRYRAPQCGSNGSSVAAEVTRAEVSGRSPWRWTIRLPEGRMVWIARAATMNDAMEAADAALLTRFSGLYEGPMPSPFTTTEAERKHGRRSGLQAPRGALSEWIGSPGDAPPWSRFYDRSDRPAATVEANITGDGRWVWEIRDPAGRTVQFGYRTTAEEACAAADESLMTKFSDFHDGLQIQPITTPKPLTPPSNAAPCYSAEPWVETKELGPYVDLWARALSTTPRFRTASVRRLDHTHWRWVAWDSAKKRLYEGTASSRADAMRLADAKLSELGVRHDDHRPGDPLDELTGRNEAPVAAPQRSPSPPAERVAFVAGPWVYASLFGSFWCRELKVPAGTPPSCAIIHLPDDNAARAEMPYRYRAFHPITGQEQKSAYKTLIAAAEAANRFLTQIGIEHDGLLPGQTIVKG